MIEYKWYYHRIITRNLGYEPSLSAACLASSRVALGCPTLQHNTSHHLVVDGITGIPVGHSALNHWEPQAVQLKIAYETRLIAMKGSMVGADEGIKA